MSVLCIFLYLILINISDKSSKINDEFYEDAMVINRGSWQRGLCHGTVIKVERINLAENARMSSQKTETVFMANPNNHPPSIGTYSANAIINNKCFIFYLM